MTELRNILVKSPDPLEISVMLVISKLDTTIENVEIENIFLISGNRGTLMWQKEVAAFNSLG